MATEEKITITKGRYEELLAIEQKVLEEKRNEYYKMLDAKRKK